jgi:hypothetical protein
MKFEEKKIDKSFVGKYVCFAKDDGSFTWGRIKDQGFQNSVKGEREVFILTDQIVCRVANNALELNTIQNLGLRIEAGTAGPTMIGPTDPKMLPSYQKFGERRLLAEKTDNPEEEEKSFLPVPVKEKQGLVPAVNRVMKLEKSKGLPIMQKVGMVVSSVDGHEINFLLRRFGYDTSVVVGSLNLKTDIVNPDDAIYDGMLDGEVFLMAMQAKLSKTDMSGMFKKPLELKSGE